MGEITINQRVGTQNQAAFDRLYKSLLIFGNSFLEGETFENIEGATTTFPIGTVLGRISLSQNLTVCKSGAVNGSEEPVAILTQTITDLADAGTVKISPVNGGEVNSNIFVFDGLDDLDTVVAGSGKSMRDLLIRNGKDLEIRSISDDSKYAN